MRIFGAIDDLAEIAEADGRSVPVGHDHLPELGRVEELSGRLQRERRVRSDDVARGDVDVPRRQGRFDLVDADLAGRQRVRIHLCVDRVLLTAEYLDLRDTADLRDSLCDARFRPVIERICWNRGRSDHEVENRLVRRVDFGESRRCRHPERQQPRGGRDGRLSVDGGAVETAVQGELERDLRRSERD